MNENNNDLTSNTCQAKGSKMSQPKGQRCETS